MSNKLYGGSSKSGYVMKLLKEGKFDVSKLNENDFRLTLIFNC